MNSITVRVGDKVTLTHFSYNLGTRVTHTQVRTVTRVTKAYVFISGASKVPFSRATGRSKGNGYIAPYFPQEDTK